MSLWLLMIVVLFACLALCAVAFSIPFFVDLVRHRKARLAQTREQGGTDRV